MVKQKPKITHTIEEMKLICKVTSVGNGAHIILPKKLIGKEVLVYYKNKK